jgi:hypothetical protein
MPREERVPRANPAIVKICVENEHYGLNRVPNEVPLGLVLVHNHIRHRPSTPIGA